MYELFSVYGVELEYMIVSSADLSVLPVSDALLTAAAGELTQDYEEGDIAWSNELVLHVIELKTNGPTNSLEGLDGLFHREILKINNILAPLGGRLMPAAMHPFMNPDKEMKLWYFGRKEVYEAFDRIFNCKGHGWANLQSAHLNLPFANDEEFAKLHAAIRVILPLIPSLAASSPFKDGTDGGYADTRLSVYKDNQKRIPSIAGQVIPEPVYSRAEYEEKILNRIYADIAPHDPEGILCKEWLNSRGAIARFSRNAIEIRLIDIQECPKADLAAVSLITEILKRLTSKKLDAIRFDGSAEQAYLAELLGISAEKGSDFIIKNKGYLKIFSIGEEVTAKRFWEILAHEMPADSPYKEEACLLTRLGNLSQRITGRIGKNPSSQEIKEVYGELADCLAENRFFKP